MPFYDEKSALHEFIVIDSVPVNIMRTRRGGQCCMVDLQVNELNCPICGSEVEAETVYFPIINGSALLLYSTDAEEAKDLAVRWISDKKVTPASKRLPRGKRKADTAPTVETGDDEPGSRYEEILKQAAKLGWGQKLISFIKDEDTEDSSKKKTRNVIPRRR